MVYTQTSGFLVLTQYGFMVVFASEFTLAVACAHNYLL
jgi:hypothetical protein